MADAPSDPPFDLTPTDDQQLMREAMQRFAMAELRPAGQQADVDGRAPDALMTAAAELGVIALALPEAHGGAGEQRSPITNALILEDLAYGDMGLALAALAPLGVVNTLVDHGTAAQQSAHLPRFAEERPVPAALALGEPGPLAQPGAPQTRAAAEGDGYRLEGVKSMVPLGQEAEILLVAAGLHDAGPGLFIVPADAPGLSRAAETTMGLGSLGLSRVELDGVHVPADALLAESGHDAAYHQAVDLSRLALCAATIGTCQAVVDYARDYANERVAFGEPISHRQSVAFMIADMAIELEGMRLMTWRAASRAEQGLSFHREAYLAHLLCVEKGMEIGTQGVQVLGGHGFTKEHPVELWYRQLRGTGVVEGAASL